MNEKLIILTTKNIKYFDHRTGEEEKQFYEAHYRDQISQMQYS